MERAFGDSTIVTVKKLHGVLFIAIANSIKLLPVYDELSYRLNSLKILLPAFTPIETAHYWALVRSQCVLLLATFSLGVLCGSLIPF